MKSICAAAFAVVCLGAGAGDRAMKRFLVALLSLGAAVVASIPADAKDLSGQERAQIAGQPLIGMRAPNLVLKTIDGQQIDLGKLYGKKAVYLKFWATWCVPCREQMPHFEHVYQTAGPDLVVVAIDSGFNDSLEEVKTYREKVGITMPIVLDDGELGSIFHLRVTPQHIVIGRDGRIQYVGNLADQQLDGALLAARQSAGQSTMRPTPQHPARAAADAPTRADHYSVGDRLPDLTVPTLAGAHFRFRDSQAGGRTVLVFLSPWCESYLATSRPAMSSSCKKVREQVESLAAKSKDVRWLGIASGLWATADDLASYRTQYGVEVPLVLDDSGKLFRAFRVMNVPTLLIADSNGQIVSRVDGFDPGLPEKLLQ